MNSILSRRVGLALGFAALAVSSGCASNRKEGPELNPTVSIRPCFVGTAGLRRAELEIEVEQREPYVMHDHTWSVHMWTSIASSNVLTQGQLDSIMSEPPFASMPDLNARKSEVEFKTLDYRVPRRGGYYVVVVAAVEMTKGPHPAVHAVRTYAKAFQEGGTEWREVKLPEFSEMATMTTVEDTKYEPAPEPGEPKG